LAGYETITWSRIPGFFAAAVSACGELTASAGMEVYLRVEGQSSQGYMNYPNAIWLHAWQRPDHYISNSPIFMAHRVTTPF